MVRKKLTLAERWQAVGMSQAGLSNKRVAGQIGVHHSVTDRLIQHLQATGMVIMNVCDLAGPAKLHLERFRLIAWCASRNYT